jgi:site-specific DNA recombinase
MILSCSRYYRGDDACYFNWLPEADALATLADHLRRMADGANLEDYAFSFATSDQGALAAAERALEQCADRFKRQIAAYEAGVLDLDELRTAKERLAAERAAIEGRIAAERAKSLRADLPAALIRQRVAHALRVLDEPGGDIAARRTAVQEAVAGMTYSRRERRLRITFRV